MWILKNSTNLLSSLGHLGVYKATSIQTFDFYTLYTSIPHDLLKSRMNNIINNAFKHKNGATRYTHIKVGRNKSYFTSDPLNGDNKYTANDICKMIEFLVDNIYARFGRQLFRQMVGIPMETNCAPLLADLFLYSYENEFLDKLIKEGKRKLARRFNLSYRYIDDLISFNNKRFKEFISDIYPKELTISETTESTSVASYLDLLFTRDRSNNITTKLYDERDAFGFHIVNFPFMSSNIPSHKKGYLRGSPDLIINNLHKHYTGFALEFKSPKGYGVLSPDQSMMLQQYQNNGFKTLVSNYYDHIIEQLIEYFRDVRILCSYCPRRFISSQLLRNHIESFHKRV